MERLKHISVVLLSVIMLSACGKTNTQTTTSVSAASQDEFLQSMAAGISVRLADNTDEANMTEEEKAKCYQKLVDTELAQIEKYDDATFDDARFNSLAHEYISACRSQKLATEYYQNQKLYNALWSGAYDIRAAIITYMYENYQLPITSEQAAEYANSTASYTVDSNTSDIFDAFNDEGEVQLSQGDLSIVGTTQKRNESSLGDVYFEFAYIVKNNSSATLNSISVDCSILDKDENILGTIRASVDATIPPTKNATCNSTIALSDYPTAKYIRVDNVSYDGNNNYIVHQIPVDSAEISKYIITISQ